MNPVRRGKRTRRLRSPGAPGACAAAVQAAALALCLFSSSACQRDASATLERGDRLLALGQHKPAIVEYQAALNLEPNAHAHRGLGLAFEALSAFAEAERHLQSALDAKPGDADARVALARVSTRFGRYEKARAELLTAIEQNPEHDGAVLLLGVYAETRPQVQQAIDRLESHIERRRRLGHSVTHETQLVLADLLARINQAEAADRLRENIRYTPLGNTPLTLELARASSDRDNHQLARQLLLPLVDRHPSEGGAWEALAISALELGHIGDAREAMKHLAGRARELDVRLLSARLGLASGLETAPTSELRAMLADLAPDRAHDRARIRRVLAGALIEQRHHAEAESELAALLTEAPRDIEGNLMLAELHLAQGKREQAAQRLSALTEHHGRLARAYELLGRAHLGDAQLEAAEQAFRRLWELAPHEPEARYWLAVTLSRRDQLDQSRRLLEGNLKRFATHGDSLRALALVLEQRSGERAARDFIVAHAKQYADSPEIAAIEGAWLMQHDDPERALAAYRRALVLDPSYFPVVAALSQFYARHDKSDLAHSVVEGALAHSPKELPLLLLAARITSDLRRYDQAREYSERALELNPDHPLALAELASLHAEGFRDIPRARELAARAYAAAPARAEVLDALGWVTHLGGDPEHALPHLEQAAEQEPHNPRVLYHLGAALLSAGRATAANAKLGLVLRLDPLFPTAEEIRVLLARR